MSTIAYHGGAEWAALWLSGDGREDMEFFATREEAEDYLREWAPAKRDPRRPYLLARVETPWPPAPPDPEPIPRNVPLRLSSFTETGEEVASTTTFTIHDGGRTVFAALPFNRTSIPAAFRLDFVDRSILLDPSDLLGWRQPMMVFDVIHFSFPVASLDERPRPLT